MPPERNLKTQHSLVIVDLDLGKTLTGKRHPAFSRGSVLECFLSRRKRKAGVLKFLRFKERFRKALCSRRISVNGRPNRRKKAAFLNCSDLAEWGSVSR